MTIAVSNRGENMSFNNMSIHSLVEPAASLSSTQCSLSSRQKMYYTPSDNIQKDSISNLTASDQDPNKVSRKVNSSPETLPPSVYTTHENTNDGHKSTYQVSNSLPQNTKQQNHQDLPPIMTLLAATELVDAVDDAQPGSKEMSITDRLMNNDKFSSRTGDPVRSRYQPLPFSLPSLFCSQSSETSENNGNNYPRYEIHHWNGQTSDRSEKKFEKDPNGIDKQILKQKPDCNIRYINYDKSESSAAENWSGFHKTTNKSPPEEYSNTYVNGNVNSIKRSLPLLSHQFPLSKSHDIHPSPMSVSHLANTRSLQFSKDIKSLTENHMRKDAHRYQNGKTREVISHKGAASTQPGVARYSCHICSKAFSRPSSLRIHSYSHTGERPFVCTVPGCNRSFSVRSNMRRHMRVHRSY